MYEYKNLMLLQAAFGSVPRHGSPLKQCACKTCLPTKVNHHKLTCINSEFAYPFYLVSKLHNNTHIYILLVSTPLYMKPAFRFDPVCRTDTVEFHHSFSVYSNNDFNTIHLVKWYLNLITARKFYEIRERQ